MMKRIHYGYIIVMCLSLVMFVIVGLTMSCAGIFYKPVSEELGTAVGKFGLYMSLNFLFSTFSLSFAGKLIERYSARIILTSCSAITGCVFMAMSWFNSLWEFYLAGALFGIALAFLLYLGLPTLLNRWFRSRMGLFIGICSAGSGLGGVLFNPLAGYLISEFGWRTAYLIFGLIILLLVTPILGIFLRNYPKDKGLEPYGAIQKNPEQLAHNNSLNENSGIAYECAVRMFPFYAMIVFAFLMNGAATLNVFLPVYIQNIEFSLEEASFVASAAMVGVTAGKVGLGMINDRSTMMGVCVTTLLGMSGILLLLMGHIHIILSVTGGFLFGWAYAGVSVQTPLLVREVFGNRNYARIYSNVSMAIAIGGAVAVGGWGLLADATSYRFVFCTGFGFLLLSALIGIYVLKFNKYK